MLDEHKIEYRYRDYTKERLARSEITKVLQMLGVGPKEVLRTNDPVYKDLRLTGHETDAQLVTLMTEHPTLLQRPIGVNGNKAALGRPVENLLQL